MEKAQFKVGSLDQLMALNETSAKLDSQLDITCKKFEKVCFDNGANELHYTDEENSTIKSNVPAIFISYVQRTTVTTSRPLSGTPRGTCIKSLCLNFAEKSPK